MNRAIEVMDKGIWFLVSLATIALVLLTFEQVVARYLFNEASIAIQELLWHLFGFLFLISLGVTLKNDRHVRVDIFYGRLGEKGKAWIDTIGILFS